MGQGAYDALKSSLGSCVSTSAFQLLKSNVVNDLVLLESMMDNMTARQRDPCTAVRMLALRGLGNMALGSPGKVRAEEPPAPAVDAVPLCPSGLESAWVEAPVAGTATPTVPPSPNQPPISTEFCCLTRLWRPWRFPPARMAACLSLVSSRACPVPPSPVRLCAGSSACSPAPRPTPKGPVPL